MRVAEGMAEPDRAIVIGASIAGLLAARVLSDHFDEVVIVERDLLPHVAEFRKGVPQSRHLHVLLARGAQILEQLFPGFRDSLCEAGAQPIDWCRDVLWLGAAGWGTRFEHSLTLILTHRELLEWSIRQRVLASERVRCIQEHDVTDLLARSGPVMGIRLRARPDGEVHDLTARLVVDASGRNSKAPEWLAALGYAKPRETVINSFLGYASRQYLKPAELQLDWKALFFMAKAPKSTRTGVLFPIDASRWMVTLAGVGRDYPPNDEAGFLDFARGLRSPILYEAIRHALPLTPISAYRRTENQWRRYDELKRWPEGFIVLGDAVCAFNPIYGQGMTVAAQSAVVLDHWLRRPDPARGFQRALGKTVATPWLLATGEDFRFPSTEGGRPGLTTRLAHRYFDRLLEVSTVDETVAQAFLRVLHLLEPPSVLFRPGIVARAARGPSRPLLTAPPTATPIEAAVGQRV
jgi:2-polyprenyl-6-methoxyphenol hydroxylase-like FAD-dependent oxidoreductase